MEAQNTDSVSSKERHGVVSYSINGILGLYSEADSVKDLSGRNVKEESEENEGKLQTQPAQTREIDRLLLFSFQESWRIVRINAKGRMVILTANLTRRCVDLWQKSQLF